MCQKTQSYICIFNAAHQQVVQAQGKNVLFNLISHQTDIDSIYLYAEDPFEPKYPFQFTKLKMCDNPKAFIKDSNDMDIYTKILMNKHFFRFHHAILFCSTKKY